MNSAISKGMGRGTSLLFYDVTNFYFEIGDPDPDIEDEDGNGYIISKRLKKSTQENREWAIDQTGYTVVDKNFKYKSRIITISVKDRKRIVLGRTLIYCVRHHCFLSISIQPQQNLFFSPKRKFCTNHSI